MLDYQLRSATHGMIVDVTTYKPDGMLSGCLQRKGRLNWNNKFFRIEKNPETGVATLVQHPDEQQNATDDQWEFSQIENLVFDIDEQYISIYPRNDGDPIRLHCVDEDAFNEWVNCLYFRVFPPDYILEREMDTSSILSVAGLGKATLGWAVRFVVLYSD